MQENTMRVGTRVPIRCRVASPQPANRARQTVRGNKGQTVRGGPRPQQRKTVSSRDGGVTGPREGGDGYINITGFPFPLGPITQRKTYRYEVDPGRIWTFEQRQSLGFTSVSTSVRMTVIKLKSGGLWVHAPVAPTAYVDRRAFSVLDVPRSCALCVACNTRACSLSTTKATRGVYKCIIPEWECHT